MLNFSRKRTYNLYCDPGHAWLKVPKKDLDLLNLSNKITHYSYMRGSFAYLEEDRDLSVFLDALKQQGGEFKVNTHSANKSSRIRNYQPYSATSNEPKEELITITNYPKAWGELVL